MYSYAIVIGILSGGVVAGIMIGVHYLIQRKKNSKWRAEESVVPADYSQTTDILEQERHRIASDLHDELGSLLGVISLDLDLVLREADVLTPHGESRLLEIKKNLNHLIKAIRHNIWSLSPEVLDQVQLGDVLKELCDKLEAYKGTHLKFQQHGDVRALSPKEKLNLFRIVQELLTNAVKHSGAWNIIVELTWLPNKVMVKVEDDGSGYQRQTYEKTSGGGMGTVNILKRANSIGATVSREELSRGLRVRIELPLPNLN